MLGGRRLTPAIRQRLDAAANSCLENGRLVSPAGLLLVCVARGATPLPYATTDATLNVSTGIPCRNRHVMAIGRSPSCDTYVAGPRH